jgi:hypothetical protein
LINRPRSDGDVEGRCAFADAAPLGALRPAPLLRPNVQRTPGTQA